MLLNSNNFKLKRWALMLGVSLCAATLSTSLYACEEQEETGRTSTVSSTSSQDTPYDRWAPLQGSVMGKKVLLQKQEVEGDSVLGFCAFDLSRDQAVSQLLEHKKDEKVRAFVKDELYQKFLEDRLPSKMPKTASRNHRKKYFSAQKDLEEIIKDLNDDHSTSGKDAEYFKETLKEDDEARGILLKALAKVQKKKEASEEHCASEKFFANYVNAYLKEEEGWLNYGKGGTGLIYALAYLNHVDLYIWRQESKESKKLRQIHNYKAPKAKSYVHLLHEEGAKAYTILLEMKEKDLMFQLSRKVEQLEAKNVYLENVIVEKLKQQEKTFSKQIKALEERFDQLEKKKQTLDLGVLAQKKST